MYELRRGGNVVVFFGWVARKAFFTRSMFRFCGVDNTVLDLRGEDVDEEEAMELVVEELSELASGPVGVRMTCSEEFAVLRAFEAFAAARRLSCIRREGLLVLVGS